jgi:hypothetical protein
LTYYMQRDGIVKSIGGLIRRRAELRPHCVVGLNTAKPGLGAAFGPPTDPPDGYHLPLF